MGLAPASHHVRLTAAQEAEASRFLEALRQGGVSPPGDGKPGPALLEYLAGEGLVEDAGSGVVFDTGVYREMLDRTVAHLGDAGSVSLAEVRDLFGTSRKYAQAFLEHLDGTHVTRRVGDRHVLRTPPGGRT